MQLASTRRLALTALMVLDVSALAGDAWAKPRLSDLAIKRRIISESIASYPGNCPCPYNVARNGSSCGRRSAYSRAGGYAPVCYPNDVSKSDVETYRRAQGGR
jgi:hypothetical protein